MGQRWRYWVAVGLLSAALASCARPGSGAEVRWNPLPPPFAHAHLLEAPLAYLGTRFAVQRQAATLGLPCRSQVLVFKVRLRPGVRAWTDEVRALERAGLVLGSRTAIAKSPYVRVMLIDTRNGDWVIALRRSGGRVALWGLCATRSPKTPRAASWPPGLLWWSRGDLNP